MKRSGRWRMLAVVALACGGMMAGLPSSRAQSSEPQSARAEQPPEAPKAKETPQAGARKELARKNEHRFWDKQNDWLFAGVGAARTLDYFSTLNMRRRGRQEILLTNDVVDNHAAFASVEAAGTAASIGAAYLFHHFEHHKLERWTSYVHIGLATTGSVRNYCLKTAHLATPPSAP